MNVLIFDTETTDREPGREIIEAAWLKLRSEPDLLGGTDSIPEFLAFDEFFCSRYRPVTRSLTYGAMAVHHILPSDLANAPPCTEFKLPSDTTYLIGHSIDFDWEAAGSPKDVKRIDTCAIAKWTWTEADSYSQSALLYYLQGADDYTRSQLRHAHGAAVDAKNNLALLGFLLNAHPTVRTWSGLWELSEKCRIPRTCPMAKYRGVLLEDLDEGFIFWCLRQPWLDQDYPYYRQGLERVLEARYPPRPAPTAAPAAATSGDDDDDLPF